MVKQGSLKKKKGVLGFFFLKHSVKGNYRYIRFSYEEDQSLGVSYLLTCVFLVVQFEDYGIVQRMHCHARRGFEKSYNRDLSTRLIPGRSFLITKGEKYLMVSVPRIQCEVR